MSRPQLRLLKTDYDLPQRYVDAFLDSKRAAGRAESTISFYATVLREFSQFIAEWPPIPDDIEACLLHKRQTVSETTVRTTWRGISAFLNWCERRGHLNDNPLREIDPPAQPRKLPKAATKDDIRAIFRAIGDEAIAGDTLAIRDHALFRLAYSAGVRCSELARLTFDNLDLDYNALTVRQGKGRKDRTVYFSDRCVAVLCAWLLIHPGGDWVFTNRLRTRIEPLTRGGIYKALQRWCDIAGVRLTVHQLRHSYATHALRNGIDLEHISRQLGHSSITTTAIYLAADDPARRQAHLDRAPDNDL